MATPPPDYIFQRQERSLKLRRIEAYEKRTEVLARMTRMQETFMLGLTGYIAGRYPEDVDIFKLWQDLKGILNEE